MRRLQLKPIPFYIQMTVFLPLVMILLLCVGILVFNRMQKIPQKEETPATEPIVSPVGVLCVLREGETAFFTEVSVDPTARTVRATPLTDGAIKDIYDTHGAAYLREWLYDSGTAVDFYLDITFEQLRELLQYLGSGIAVTLEETVTHTDAVGLTVSFPVGMHTLSANQTVDLLRGIAEKGAQGETVAYLWADILCRYMVKERNPLADYTALVDMGDTDIRIYDFHKALPYIKKVTEEGPLTK